MDGSKPVKGSDKKKSVAKTITKRDKTTTKRDKKSTGTSAKSTRTSATIDFNVLNLASLRRYKKYYKLQTRQTQHSKGELVQLVAKHFKNRPVMNTEEIPIFLWVVKHGGN